MPVAAQASIGATRGLVPLWVKPVVSFYDVSRIRRAIGARDGDEGGKREGRARARHGHLGIVRRDDACWENLDDLHKDAALPPMSPASNLSGRVALVTGGAQGLGRAIAERLAAEGCRLVVADIDSARLAACQDELCRQFGAVLAIEMDVSNEFSVRNGFAAIAENVGRLDILVNNAGIIGLRDGKRPLVEEMSLDLWQRTLAVNLTGAFLASRSAIPLMKAGKWGRIINMSSRAGRTRTGLGHSNYAASKAGLIGFSRSLAGEVGRDGITVNCIAPSRVRTSMTDTLADSAEAFARNIAETAVGRLATSLDVAGVAAFLCSDAASFLTGIVIDVNGGSYMP